MPEDNAAPASETRYRVAFSHVSGIGPTRLGTLLESFDSLAAAWAAPERALARVLDPRSLASLLATRRRLDLDRVLRDLDRQGIAVITPGEPHFPDGLRMIHGAPYLLYVRGNTDCLHKTAVAVVGTRSATVYGLRAARRLAGDLAQAGLAVVSGLAVGIDAAAHGAALAVGGTTIAVLGCGLDRCYPLDNRRLRADIERHGAVVSEFPPGTAPEPGHFPSRNRIVSGMAQGVLVVEAGDHSGALITARLAAEQGRDVFAVPSNIDSPVSAGVNRLIAEGAHVVTCSLDVLVGLGLDHLARSARQAQLVPEDETEAAVLAALGAEPRHVDDVSRACGLTARDVTRTLTVMEVKGMVVHVGHMRWTAAR